MQKAHHGVLKGRCPWVYLVKKISKYHKICQSNGFSNFGYWNYEIFGRTLYIIKYSKIRFVGLQKGVNTSFWSPKVEPKPGKHFPPCNIQNFKKYFALKTFFGRLSEEISVLESEGVVDEGAGSNPVNEVHVVAQTLLHPVHRSDGVEPPEPATPGQVPPDADRLQVLQGLQVGLGQPGVVQALVGRQSILGFDLEQVLDAVDGLRWDLLELRLTEATVDQKCSCYSSLGPVGISGPERRQAYGRNDIVLFSCLLLNSLHLI